MVLEVAERRLREQGLDGLNITGVAEEAGISHATVLHHFGSVAGMRNALADKMILALISDMAEAMSSRVPPQELIQNLFVTLAEGRHSTLIAWRAIENRQGPTDPNLVADLFGRMLGSARETLDVSDESDARQLEKWKGNQ